MKRLAFWAALLASFAVYLIPLVERHGFWLLGQVLVAELARPAPGRTAGWKLVDCATAAAMQLTAGILFYRFFCKRTFFRAMALIAFAPICLFVANSMFTVVIPKAFLIETDVSPVRTDWEQACAVPNASLVNVKSPPGPSPANAGPVWIATSPADSYAILTMPDCGVTPLDFGSVRFSPGNAFALPDGRCVFETWDIGTGQKTWWHYGGPGTTAEPLSRPPADPNRAIPILSNDGESVGWIQFVPGVRATPLPQEVLIRSLHGMEETTVSLPPPGQTAYVLLGIDTTKKELTLFEHDYKTSDDMILGVGFDGVRRWGPVKAAGIQPQSNTFLILEDGWVAWDAYKENENYRVGWSLPQGRGTHRILKGRSITALAVCPDGKYLALSVTTSLNIGDIKDSVYVLRASDGSEVFRRYLPTFARSDVAFLGNSYFAYTDWDGTNSQVRVLRVAD
jgi:hypothetical protein